MDGLFNHLSKNPSGTMDRISRLPEPILQHILSFLDLKEIVRASSVSKKWQHAWNTFQILDFHSRLFNFGVPPDGGADEVGQWLKTKEEQVYDFVDRTLLARREQQIAIKRLSLCLSSDAAMIAAADRWIGYAVEGNVQVLNVNCPSPDPALEYTYKLSPVVFAAESISELDLTSCKLVLPQDHSVKLTSLRMLSLCQVYADDDLMKTLFAGCPVIEVLKIYYCYGFKNLHLPHHLTKLNQVRIDNNHHLERLTIDASNLQTLVIYGPSLLLDRVNGAACKNLKELLLLRAAGTDEYLRQQLSKFPLLEKLMLADCEQLKIVKISSRHLKELTITYSNELVGVEIDAPCLHTFCYHGNVIPFSPNDFALSKVSMGLTSHNICLPLDAKTIAFMSIFCRRARLLNLWCLMPKDLVVPKVVRETMPSPSYIAKEINLKIARPIVDRSTVELVDAMLWMSPHVEQLSIDSLKKFYFKFSYGRQVNEGETPCCNSVPVKCWRHCIKSVKIMKICSRDPWKAENYYFEDDIWKNIDDLLNSEEALRLHYKPYYDGLFPGN